MVNLKKDNDDNKSSKFTWINIILGVATIILGIVIILQSEHISQQQIELDQATQNAQLKLALFDKVVDSIGKKNEQQQKIFLVLLDSLDEVDKEYRKNLLDVITTETLNLEIRVKGLLQGGNIIYRAGNKENSGFTDFDIFLCKPSLQEDKRESTFNLLYSVLKVVGETDKTGRIRGKLWRNYNEFSIEQLKGKTTVITDKGHGEKEDADRIMTAIKDAKVTIPEVIDKDNPIEKKTPWLVSIVLCP